MGMLALIPLLLVEWEDATPQPLVTAREEPEGEILPADLTTDPRDRSRPDELI